MISIFYLPQKSIFWANAFFSKKGVKNKSQIKVISMEKTLREKFHGLFFITFTLINLAIFTYIKYYIKDDCECANDKVFGLIQPIDFIMVFALLGVLVGIVNIFINLNRGLSSLPLLGTFFNFGVCFICVLQIYMIVVFLKRINNQKCIEIKKCQNKTLKKTAEIISGLGLSVYIVAFIIGILIVWI